MATDNDRPKFLKIKCMPKVIYLFTQAPAIWSLFTGPVESSFQKVSYTGSHSLVIKTRRYSLLRGPTFSSCRGHWPPTKGFFCPSGKKDQIFLFWPILGNFWWLVVTLVVLKKIIFFLKK